MAHDHILPYLAVTDALPIRAVRHLFHLSSLTEASGPGLRRIAHGYLSGQLLLT